jgi:hypothetical protein
LRALARRERREPLDARLDLFALALAQLALAQVRAEALDRRARLTHTLVDAREIEVELCRRRELVCQLELAQRLLEPPGTVRRLPLIEMDARACDGIASRRRLLRARGGRRGAGCGCCLRAAARGLAQQPATTSTGRK